MSKLHTGALTAAAVATLLFGSGFDQACAAAGTDTQQQAAPQSKVKAGEVVRAVIVRTAYSTQRSDGTTIRFDTNAAVILNQKQEPIGTRIFGPVGRELRSKNFMKIVSLAPEVV